MSFIIKSELERLDNLIDKYSLLRLTSETNENKKLCEKMVKNSVNLKLAFQNLLLLKNEQT